MKHVFAALATLAVVPGSLLAQFSVGNLAVFHVGDGVAALAGNAAPVAIEEYTTAGLLANTFSLPDTGVNAFTVTGNATAEGGLSRSVDGTLLTFAGYNLARPFGTSPAAATSATAPRAVGTMTYNGTFGIPSTTTTAFSGNGIRSAATDGANNYWGIANGGGVYYFGNTAVAGQIAANPANNRVMNNVAGNLYFSTGSGTVGIYGFSGAPTAPAATNAVLLTAGTGTGTASPYDFAFNAGMTLAYVADDRTIANGGGIQRWDWNGSSWALTYTLNPGGTGARGLAVDFSGANPIIYATTTETSNTRLVKITDTGALSASSDLATAGLNKAFRGLEFAPVQVPEPSIFALIGMGLTGLLVLRRRQA